MENEQTKLSKGLSYDEFMKLAERRPNLDGEWIYRLEQTELGDSPRNYPVFKVGATHLRDFSSLEDAEKYLREQSALIPMYRSRITQIPVGGTDKERGAQWLYDSEGILADITVVAKAGTAEEANFFGRRAIDQRFSPLDFAEILDGDEVKLVVVLGRVAEPSELWQEYQTDDSEYSFGYEYDSYTILADESGELTRGAVTALMEPRLEISPEDYKILNRRMEALFDAASSGDCPDLEAVPILDDDEWDPFEEDNDNTMEED